MTAPLFAEVAVTVPAPGRFHYRVPAHLAARAQIGARVLVKFGGKKLTGVVVRVPAGEPPAGVKVVDLGEVLDDTPSLSLELVELCTWVAEYYEAPPGEVMRAALPAGSGVAEKQVLVLTDTGRAALGLSGARGAPVASADMAGALPAKQRVMLAKLADGPLPVAGLSEATRAVVTALETAGLVGKVDRRRARVKPKVEKVAELLRPAAALREELAAARANPARDGVIAALAAGPLALAALEAAVPKARPALAALVKASRARVFDREVSTVAVVEGVGELEPAEPPALTHEQTAAVAAILAAAPSAVDRTSDLGPRTSDRVSARSDDDEPGAGSSSRADALSTGEQGTSGTLAEVRGPRPEVPNRRVPFLLHGVTGSGKTEVYLRVIAEVLARGKTALVLVPEIALTPQLAARFRARFGDRVAVLHSGLSEQARLGEWTRLHRGEATIAVGARSAVFAPLANLGAIVVDEEHDGSYKQDEGVKYHARDVALVRAQRAGALCILGSATPSLETFAHAETGAYHRLVLTQRPTARPMPAVEILDLKQYIADKESLLTAPLHTALEATLAAGDQAILFLNRRGFATFCLCMACGTSLRCKNCAVALTYHKDRDRLACHYCNFVNAVPDLCGKCGSAGLIEMKGLGTERVAAAIAAAFPTARVARLDRDVASGAKVEPVLAKVGRREIDILVGTQMVTKGHDFPGVTLVGVLCADTGLNLPDFRAAERTFQLLAQVAGRAGRGDRPGRVLIQTYRPDAPAVRAAAAHDYQMFATAELAARAELRYPPHGRLIAVRIDGPEEHAVARLAMDLSKLAMRAADAAEPDSPARPEADRRRGEAGAPPVVEVVGPVAAPLSRLRGRTRWQIWLRGTDRHALRRVARAIAAAEVAAPLRVSLDVDPISTL